MKVKKCLLSLLMLCLLTLSFGSITQAKTTYAKSTSLKDVRNAKEVTGEWIKTEAGYKFKTSSGKYLKSQWLKYNGSIYYVNSNGQRVKGWIKYRNSYYYMGNGGKMFTGWLDAKRYLRSNGKRASGKLTIKGLTYYFSPKTGEWQSGWIRIKKNYYHFNKTTGVMDTDRFVVDGKTVKYVTSDGVMLTNAWLFINGKKYYLDYEGVRVTGEQYVDGKWRYFDKKGVYDPDKKVTNTINPSKKMVALTFDDGPGPYTTRLLNCLRKNGARATFFMVGSNVGRRKSVVRQMASQGCELGNHSYNHPNLENLSTSSIKSEIKRTNNAIKNACGQTPTLCRLPYGGGHRNSRVLKAVGLPSIYWSIDTMDWANIGNPQHTINAVMNNVRSGDIVLMHDIHYSSVQAALTIIPRLKKKGYQMVTVSELAKYKGHTSMKSGKTYYKFR